MKSERLRIQKLLTCLLTWRWTVTSDRWMSMGFYGNNDWDMMWKCEVFKTHESSRWMGKKIQLPCQDMYYVNYAFHLTKNLLKDCMKSNILIAFFSFSCFFFVFFLFLGAANKRLFSGDPFLWFTGSFTFTYWFSLLLSYIFFPNF